MRFGQIVFAGFFLVDAFCFWRVALVVQGERYLPGFLVALSLFIAGVGLMLLLPAFRGLAVKPIAFFGVSLGTCIAVWLAVTRVILRVH